MFFEGLYSALKQQKPFSASLSSRIARELFRSSSKIEDEDIHSFISRRLGTEVASLLIDPVVRGIYAGDCRKLSVKSCFGPLFALEQQHGSIVKGMLTEGFLKRTGAPSSEQSCKQYHVLLKLCRIEIGLKKGPVQVTDSELVKRAKKERWMIWSLERGIGQLAEALQEHLLKSGKVEIKTNTKCKSLSFQDGKATVSIIELRASLIYSVFFLFFVFVRLILVTKFSQQITYLQRALPKVFFL